MKSTLLKLISLSKSYEQTSALRDVSFNIYEGEVVGLIGPNGAGKTSVLRSIMKYVRPDSGRVIVAGKELASLKHSELPISYIPDAPVYYDGLTIEEHLRLVCMLYGYTEQECVLAVKRLSNRLSLEDSLKKVPDKTSRGTQQKMIIACGLLREYRLLLADEPFNGLDPEQIWVLKELLTECKQQGKSVLVSTHLLDLAETFCDRYILLCQGSVLASGTKGDIMHEHRLGAENSMSLEGVFLHLVRARRETASC
ncbi:MAG: multidrug ABC transporter ATP-binding protein [Bacillota bacterium]|nr:MAG: multidrug ABC transporter ATP-binding protein [Bacillota bacterium]